MQPDIVPSTTRPQCLWNLREAEDNRLQRSHMAKSVLRKQTHWKEEANMTISGNSTPRVEPKCVAFWPGSIRSGILGYRM
jgi:hypothetical protein